MSNSDNHYTFTLFQLGTESTRRCDSEYILHFSKVRSAACWRKKKNRTIIFLNKVTSESPGRTRVRSGFKKHSHLTHSSSNLEA